ncbi:kinetochore protein Spc24-like isoform X2 [Ambystoma mexicanum]|uniref:kinetochore protein Spc24-like isoform X2 n=1 Tax=Ambystoma mexicanum TaxID=8296 RepID=UPI0037E7D4E9
MFGGQMKEMMEVSHEIIKMLNSGNLNFQKTFDKQDLIVDKLLETKVSAAEIIKDLLNLEKEAAQKLLDCADEKQQCMSQLCKIEQELHEVGEQNASLQTDIKFLTKELEELMAMEAEMQRMQEEVDEDTTEVIPSARSIILLSACHGYSLLVDGFFNCNWAIITNKASVKTIIWDVRRTPICPFCSCSYKEQHDSL